MLSCFSDFVTQYLESGLIFARGKHNSVFLKSFSTLSMQMEHTVAVCLHNLKEL